MLKRLFKSAKVHPINEPIPEVPTHLFTSSKKSPRRMVRTNPELHPIVDTVSNSNPPVLEDVTKYVVEKSQLVINDSNIVETIKKKDSACKLLCDVKSVKKIGSPSTMGYIALVELQVDGDIKKYALKVGSMLNDFGTKPIECIKKGGGRITDCNGDDIPELVVASILKEVYDKGFLYNVLRFENFSYCKDVFVDMSSKKIFAMHCDPERERIWKRQRDQLFSFMEVIDGDLTFYLKGNEPEGMRDQKSFFSIYIQVLMTMRMLNRLGINHNDLHPGNMMYVNVKDRDETWGEVNNGKKIKNVKRFFYYVPEMETETRPPYIVFETDKLIKIGDYGANSVFTNDNFGSMPVIRNVIKEEVRNLDYSEVFDMVSLSTPFMMKIKSYEKDKKYEKLNEIFEDKVELAINLADKSMVIPRATHEGQMAIHMTAKSVRNSDPMNLNFGELAELIPDHYFSVPTKDDFYLGCVL